MTHPQYKKGNWLSALSIVTEQKLNGQKITAYRDALMLGSPPVSVWQVRAVLQPRISTQLICFHFVSGQTTLHKVQLQMVTQMHFQSRPELDVACRRACIVKH